MSQSEAPSMQFKFVTYFTFAGIILALLGNQYAEGFYLNDGVEFGTMNG
jgi:hypothetical protein